jgi:hypothetical protein
MVKYLRISSYLGITSSLTWINCNQIESYLYYKKKNKLCGNISVAPVYKKAKMAPKKLT